MGQYGRSISRHWKNFVMDTLRVSLFGNIQVRWEQTSTGLPLTRTLETLLAFLLLHRQRMHPRDVLLELLWGDLTQTRARNCLNTALWRLRKTLEPLKVVPQGAFLVTTSKGEVGINPSNALWLDVAVFENRVKHILFQPFVQVTESEILAFEQTLALYNGELMEGFYEDWALRERERLREMYLNSLSYLMQYYKHHENFPKSLSYGQQILHIDPLREEVHREVMRLYSLSGERAMAIRQYENCRAILNKELRISPMPETQALFTNLIAQVNSGPQEASSTDQDQWQTALQ
jgi:DNA-binding SARP family transcriptional activator